jgi:2-polyprenyl-3-methyl-5-hydroxy-6-metoxy-1,4-benzoquinol methylase
MVQRQLAGEPELLRGARVLEIGCGGGGFSRWLAEAGAGSVIGADFAPVAIEKARRAPVPPNLSFEVQDIEAMPYDNASFDLVVSCETIEHVPRPDHAVTELGRVLAPGGTLLLTCPNYLNLLGLHRLYRNATGRPWSEAGQPINNFTTYPRTRLWVRRAGLSVVATDGDGFFVPVPRRRTGAWVEPREEVRKRLTPVATRMLLRASKP